MLWRISGRRRISSVIDLLSFFRCLDRADIEMCADMTSHEMRNPLSAILQSADSILSNLNSAGVPILTEQMTIRHDVAEEIIDAAQTIILCG